jgi:hypothetical protein
VNPVIGVSFGTIEDRIGAWTEEKHDHHISMTISSPLGYITPETRFLEWLFEPGFDNASEVTRMVRAIREYVSTGLGRSHLGGAQNSRFFDSSLPIQVESARSG